MREIKFRGLRTDGEGWVYGDLIQLDDRLLIAGIDQDAYVDSTSYVALSYHEVTPESVGQYTVLKDKNGVEIYEGDWIHCPGYSCRVEFLDGGFHTIYNHPEDSETLPMIDISLETMAVIGNIYENK